MKKWIIFLIGLVVGILGTSCFFFVREIGKGVAEWGKPQVFFYDEASARIKDEGFSLSPTTFDLYYYVDGFKNHVVYAAFSDRREILDQLVSKKTGKTIEQLEVWKGKADQNSYITEPGHRDKLYRTPLYDLDRVKKALFYQEKKDEDGWYLIYDRQNCRVYYCGWYG
jgi:hypothetical protein